MAGPDRWNAHQRVRRCRHRRDHQPGPPGPGSDLHPAKRYAEARAIDRPRTHEFAGALLGKQGDLGVFITTSRFTDGARREAERINAQIELIDGERLAPLLLRYGVGVQGEQTLTLYWLNEDYFETQ